MMRMLPCWLAALVVLSENCRLVAVEWMKRAFFMRSQPALLVLMKPPC